MSRIKLNIPKMVLWIRHPFIFNLFCLESVFSITIILNFIVDFSFFHLIQLLTEPKILFCDEPTTGLDSYSAVQVVSLLRSLANGGKMVICSIHQPASGIFENFDEVTLLASGGKMAYHGPVASINSYFSG